MEKNPLQMEYHELDALLDSLLAAEQLPSTISYQGDTINYIRQKRIRILLKSVLRLFRSQMFYNSYIKKRIQVLKTAEPEFSQLKKTRCLKNLRTYLYLSKIGLTDLAAHLGGRFDDKVFANFNIATMLYDAAFDIPECRKYLGEFEQMIMENKKVISKEICPSLFQECCDYLEHEIGTQRYQTFMHFVRIEHISQLMSIYQLADRKTSKQDLMKITYSKGGISALALMYLMVPEMTMQERKAVYELGAVMQIIDDISDLQEDMKSGIHTLPNQKLFTYKELKGLYIGVINNLIQQCHMDPHRPNGTLDMLCWFMDIILEKRYKAFFKNQ